MTEFRTSKGRAEPRHETEAPPSAEVIVCVHNAWDDVQRCLASIDAHTADRHRLILVDDASEPACRDALAQFVASHPTAVLLRNEERLGYTRTANRGLNHSQADFVVLLNSDTIVTPGWIERLLECATTDPDIGLVGPLSNSAQFQSVPEADSRNQGSDRNSLPAGWQPDDVASVVAAIAPRAFPRVGLLNGFCILIKRAVIETIGYFDEVNFPDGYGEEHDYGLRAAAAGFQLAVADHAYVYHLGTRSYLLEQRQALKRAARVALARKHKAKRLRAALSLTSVEPTLERMRNGVAAALNQTFQQPQPGRVKKQQEARSTMLQDGGSSPRRNPLLWSFMGELDTQCANAELAYTSLVLALSERAPDGSRGRVQQRKIFFYINAYMSHAAMVCAILWPSHEVHKKELAKVEPQKVEELRAIRKERGRHLRKALGDETISSLEKLKLSNYLERYDARIELWALTSASADVKDMAVSALDGHGKGDIIRHFDPITMTYTFLGEQFDLPAIAVALSQTHRSVARWVSEQSLVEANADREMTSTVFQVRSSSR